MGTTLEFQSVLPKMNFAIIPARGGSKRIPRKNIRPFFGKPIIGWSIKAAITCQLFDKIIVSTDDVEIADVSRSLGADVPFFRPENLSDDFTPTIPVIRHAIESLPELRVEDACVCCIYPCSPFLEPDDIKSGYQKLISDMSPSFVFPASEFPSAIERSFQLGSDELARMNYPDKFNIRTQDLPANYFDCGQFYWGSARNWLTRESLFESSAFINIPPWRIHDIDTLDDWHRAEMFFEVFYSKT